MSVTQWSTAEVEPSERFAYWREAVCDAFLDLRPERNHRRRFHGRIVVEQRHDLEIAQVVAGPQHVYRRPSHDGGWCYLNLQVRGTGLTSQGGITVVTDPGDAVVVRTDRPFDFRFDEDFSQLSIRLPNDLSTLVDGPMHLSGTSPAGTALLALLKLGPLAERTPAATADQSAAHVTSAGERSNDTTQPALDRWLDTAIVDLVRTSLQAHITPTTSKRPPDRWLLIDADINRHLRDPGLTPTATARRVGMSVRSLHQHFEGRPLTFAREVRNRRLLMARRLLSDPAKDGLRVRDIAMDCGFTDVHHFQKIYRQTFDQSPGATRTSRATQTSRATRSSRAK